MTDLNKTAKIVAVRNGWYELKFQLVAYRAKTGDYTNRYFHLYETRQGAMRLAKREGLTIVR